MKQCRLLLGICILIGILNEGIAQETAVAKPKTRIENLQEEIQKSPNNPELYLQLGIEDLESLRSVSNFIEKFRMQGMTVTIDTKDDTVKNLLKSKELYVLQKLEVPFLLYRSLGEAYYHYSKFQEAKIEFQNALKKIPNEFETSNLLKICETQIERVKFPQSDTLNYKLVEALFNANSIDFAKTKLAVLLEKFPENTTYKKMQEKIALAEKANELLGEGNDFSNKSDYKNALEKYTESLARYKEIGNRWGQAANHSNIGNQFQNMGDNQNAIASYEKALAISIEIGEKQLEANNLGNMGGVYQSMGDHTKALTFYEKSWNINKQIGYKQGEFYNLRNMGVLYLEKGEYNKSLEYLDKALVISREIQNRQLESSALAGIGELYWNQGDYDKAFDAQEKSLAIKKELGDRQGEADSYISLGNLYSEKGEYNKAIELQEKSLAINKEFGNKRGEAIGLLNIGIGYGDKGDFEKCFKFEEEAFQIAKQVDFKYAEMVYYMAFGQCLRITGVIPKAIESYNKALEIAESLSAKDRIAVIYREISDAYRKNKDFGKAIEYLDKAISIQTKIDKKPSLVYSNLSYARIFLEQKKSGAKEYIEKAEEFEKATHRKPLMAEIHLLRAQDLLLSKKYSEAEKEIRLAITLIEEIGNPILNWEAFRTLGDIQFAANKISESILSYQKSISSLRSMYSLLEEKKQVSFMQDKLEVYETLVTLLKREGKSDEAKKYLEESKRFISSMR